MKTAGEILQIARKEKNLGLEDLSRRIKIQPRYLKAIEESDLKNLPQETFVKGFIRAASVELDLNPDNIIAIFSRGFGTNQKGQIIPRSMEQNFQNKFNWSPKISILVAVSVTTVAFLLYLIFQLKILVSPPPLDLTYPKINATVTQNVLVEGKTDPETTVFINSQEIKKNQDGAFSQTIQLTPGTHTITVTAKAVSGKSTTLQRTIQVKEN